ncbi:MAG TPA: ABC transporter permease [Solirubrobacteraceae bacterium]|jgi:peptide/nickel transport system permease protein|nr:ABC transporter permease [Solirubrobacteraceae bacterium]
MATAPAPARLPLAALPIVRSPLARFIARRLVSLVAVLFTITVLTFLIFQAIPGGDPAVRMAGRLATPQQVQDVRVQWGFDKPIYVQYERTMEKILDGSVISYSQQTGVEQEIIRDLPPTISLALGAGVLWLVFGVLFGLLSAVRAGGWVDRLLSGVALTGISMPVFFLGAIMLYWLGYKWGVLPLGGYVPLTQDPWGWFTHMLMPWVALSVVSIGVYSRVLRANLLDVMSEDYVRTARAKGLSERRVLVRHVLRNSLAPIATLWGLDFAWVIGGGAILVESVFDLGGVGQYAAESIARLDVPAVMVITMLVAFAVVVIGAIVDVLYALLDPRVRLS